MPRRTIAAVTTSRADYSHLYWVLRDLDQHPDIDLELIVTAAHLCNDFGATVRQIERDGFSIRQRIDGLDPSDTDVGMARTIGVLASGLAEALASLRPDLLLLIADRYELLAPASAALALRIPVAHIEGGEVSQGAVDDAVRHAVTKLSHIHFAPTKTAARRLRHLGEESWRIHCTGAPSLDHLRRTPLPSRQALVEALGFEPGQTPIVVSVHPVTIARDTLRETDALFDALAQLAGEIIFCFPNADAGSRQLASRARTFCEARGDAVMVVNLAPGLYWRLLHEAGLMLGNSSSGIMESPSLELPAVNVGMRQQGRERAPNIIDCPAECGEILKAVQRARSRQFRASLQGMANPYGDGHAAERIVRVLASIEPGEQLLIKAPPGTPA